MKILHVITSLATGGAAHLMVDLLPRLRDKGNDVVEMQDCLKQLGYLDEITGVYDATTTAAVKTFQRKNGLSVDGVAGSDTLKTLYSDSAKAY